MVKIPHNFDGRKFSEKYGLDIEKDFVVRRGELIVYNMPELKDSDVQDCVISDQAETIKFYDFLDAFFYLEQGDKTKMKALLERYKELPR